MKELSPSEHVKLFWKVSLCYKGSIKGVFTLLGGAGNSCYAKHIETGITLSGKNATKLAEKMEEFIQSLK